MTLTTDPNHPGLRSNETGQDKAYLVLPEAERAKGFVRPYRAAYTHTGELPKHPLRAVTEEEKKRPGYETYEWFEAYPDSESPLVGRYWRKLVSGCGVETVMSQALAETYARDPKFYGATYCTGCGRHFPVAQFHWLDGEVVGS